MGKIFNRLALRSIAGRLAIMAAASVFFMALVAVTILLISRAELVAERTERAHAIVDSVASMADNFYNAAKTGTMTEDDA